MVVNPGPSPEDIVSRKQANDALARALGRLSPLERELVVLHYCEGLRDKEIRRVLGLRMLLVTIRSRRFRALEKLRAELKEPPE